MTWTAPRTWVAGEPVTAALLNTHLRDNLLSVGGPWETYTPAWTTSGTQPSIGNGTLTGRYARAGDWVFVWFYWEAGSTTTFGSETFFFTLPVPSRDLSAPGQAALGGWMSGVDVATASWSLWPRWRSTTTFEFVYDSAAVNGGLAAVVASAQPFTWGSGDSISGHFFYEGDA